MKPNNIFNRIKENLDYVEVKLYNKLKIYITRRYVVHLKKLKRL